MKDFLDACGFLLVIIVGVLFVGISCYVLVLIIDVKFFGNIPVKVYVNDSLVYQGISACVNTSSNGPNTLVTVSDSWMCYKPTAYYISKKVVIVNQ